MKVPFKMSSEKRPYYTGVGGGGLGGLGGWGGLGLGGGGGLGLGGGGGGRVNLLTIWEGVWIYVYTPFT